MMTPEQQLAGVMAVMFFATLTRSTFGFGEALVAVPLLSMIVEVETAATLVAASSIVMSCLIMATARHSTDWRGAALLIGSSLVGIPCGVYLLTNVPAVFVKRLLAAILIGFALFHLVPRLRWRLERETWAIPFGFLGGVLGGAYNTSGPPLVIFGTLRGWTPAQFRATLQGVFLTNSISVLTIHYFAGLCSPEVVRYVGWVLPLMLVTVPLGYWLNRRIHPEHFRRGLHAMLFALGVMLAWSTWRH